MPGTFASMIASSHRAPPDSRPSPVEDCLVRLNSDSLHDLMSPVNQMCTLTDLMLRKRGDTPNDEDEVLLGFIHEAANRLQNLLAGLRTYMQVVGSRCSPALCDANMLLDGALASLKDPVAAAGAVVTRDPLPQLYCDPGQIVYTFTSLIENSIKFRRELPPEIHISAASDEGDWLFSVRDNGIGVDPSFSERIFGVFKRVDSHAYPGRGVGLAIARQIVERHGGRIWVESEPGAGATFFFTLPRDALHQAGLLHS